MFIPGGEATPALTWLVSHVSRFAVHSFISWQEPVVVHACNTESWCDDPSNVITKTESLERWKEYGPISLSGTNILTHYSHINIYCEEETPKTYWFPFPPCPSGFLRLRASINLFVSALQLHVTHSSFFFFISISSLLFIKIPLYSPPPPLLPPYIHPSISLKAGTIYPV